MTLRNKQDLASRNSLLLTVTMPLKDNPTPFHAAMLSFPKGDVQKILCQLQNRELLSLILDGLEHDPDKLRAAAGWMEEKGCFGVEIEPVETVGYYHLKTQKTTA